MKYDTNNNMHFHIAALPLPDHVQAWNNNTKFEFPYFSYSVTVNTEIENYRNLFSFCILFDHVLNHNSSHVIVNL